MTASPYVLANVLNAETGCIARRSGKITSFEISGRRDYVNISKVLLQGGETQMFKWDLSFQLAMAAAWIILALLGLPSAVPSYRVREIQSLSLNPRAKPLGFQRGAVESPPRETPTIDRLSNDLSYDEFGTHRYPLRDAVESLPANVLYADTSDDSEG